LFYQFITKCLEAYDEPVHSIQEMREKRSTKQKGDIFESVCVLYLRMLGYKAWVLKEVNEEILEDCGLGRFDVGIDIIDFKYDLYYAVQCKFKKPRSGFVKGTWLPYNCVNWKEVSTFFSLCHRTQTKANWKRHIVMTNTKHVRRMGQATQYDKTYAYGTFNTMTRIQFTKLLESIQVVKQYVPRPIINIDDESKQDIRSIEDVRAARLKKFM
jgi:predicted helicase